MSYQTKIKFSLLSLKEVLIMSSAKPDPKLLRVSDLQGQGCFCCSPAAGAPPLPNPSPTLIPHPAWVEHHPGVCSTSTRDKDRDFAWPARSEVGAFAEPGCSHLGKDQLWQSFNDTLAWWTSTRAGSCSKDWSEIFDSVTNHYWLLYFYEEWKINIATAVCKRGLYVQL